MKLEAGNIYSFHYSNYKEDPNPMVLVLYCDEEICHALNFHYLGKTYTQELINMITLIALKFINTKSMYAHYHNWMKKNIPGVIRHSYRTYKPKYIKRPKKLTAGYWGINTFLNEYNNATKHKKLTAVQTKLSKVINKKKAEKIIKEQSKIDIEEMIKQIDKFVERAEQVYQSGKKEDLSRYTFLNK